MNWRWVRRENANGLTLALILTFSPGEKEQRSTISAFANGCPATPVSRHFKKVAKDSPSPRGRGPG